MTLTSDWKHILPRHLDWLINFWTIKLYNSKAFCRHSSLWTKATTFNRSQRGYSWSEAATVCCGQRPQNLRVYKESIWGRRPPQFVVAKGHNIWKVTLDRIPGYYITVTIQRAKAGNITMTSDNSFSFIIRPQQTACADNNYPPATLNCSSYCQPKFTFNK